jgi:hypothetical protein
MKWIKHDTDANQDAKLQNVLLDYGLEGYGLYWYCIELIAGKVNKESITFELEHDARIIARNTGSTSQKVEEMMRYFVDLGLFESSEGVITCMKLARRLDSSMTSNPEMRKIISQLKNHDGVMTKSETIMQDKIRLDKTRIEDKDNVRPDGLTPAVIKEEMNTAFDAFWECWRACKKKMSTYNNSTPKETRVKWDKYFSAAWWKKNDLQSFEGEVNVILQYADSIHNPDIDFCPAKNMGTAAFFKKEGWVNE